MKPLAPTAARKPTLKDLEARGISFSSYGRADDWSKTPGTLSYYVTRNGTPLGVCRGNSTRRNQQSSKMTAYKALRTGETSRKPLGVYSSRTEAALALSRAVPRDPREAVYAAVVRWMQMMLCRGQEFTAREIAEDIQVVDGGPCYPWGRELSTQAVRGILDKLYEVKYLGDGKYVALKTIKHLKVSA